MFTRLLIICVLFSLAAPQSVMGCDMMSKNSGDHVQISHASDADSMQENCHENSEPNSDICKCSATCSQSPSLYTLVTLAEMQAFSPTAFDPGMQRSPMGSFVETILRPPIS